MNAGAVIDRAGRLGTLIAPVVLMHGRGLADADLSIVAILFLVRSWRQRDWSWAGSTWVRIAAAWWGWLVICSLPVPLIHTVTLGEGGTGSLVQALATCRFGVFAAALECWVLRSPRARRDLRVMLAIAVGYIALQSLLQLATGRNLFGQPRFPDGSLTGPYAHPRAAAPLSRLLFAVLLPVAAGLAARGGVWRRVAAVAIGAAALALMVLMGQRMPLLLDGLGLVVVGLVMPRLRIALLGLVLALPAMVGVASLVSPPAFHHLWTVFSRQMAHLPSSPYGLIAARAVAMVRADPLTGRGFDGYRTGCADPRYFHGWFGGDGRGAWAGVCVQHPHNHYLQAAVEGGLPGLVLFVAMVGAWIMAAGRGLSRKPDPLQAGLLAAIVIQEWPIASASAFTNMPLGGWFFLLLGFGLAIGRDHMAPADMTTNGRS